MTNLVLYVNDVQHPSKQLSMGCSLPFWGTRAFETFFSSTGIHYDDHAHMITLEMFIKGFYELGFALTLDRKADREHISLPLQGNMRIETRLKKTVTRTRQLHFVC